MAKKTKTVANVSETVTSVETNTEVVETFVKPSQYVVNLVESTTKDGINITASNVSSMLSPDEKYMLNYVRTPKEEDGEETSQFKKVTHFERISWLSFYEAYQQLKAVEAIGVFSEVNLVGAAKIPLRQLVVLTKNFNIVVCGDTEEFKSLARLEQFSYDEQPNKLTVYVWAGEAEERTEMRTIELNNIQQDGKIRVNFINHVVLTNNNIDTRTKCQLLNSNIIYYRAIEIITMMEKAEEYEELNININNNGMIAYVLSRAFKTIGYVKLINSTLSIETFLSIDSAEKTLGYDIPVNAKKNNYRKQEVNNSLVSGDGLDKLREKFKVK